MPRWLAATTPTDSVVVVCVSARADGVLVLLCRRYRPTSQKSSSSSAAEKLSLRISSRSPHIDAVRRLFGPALSIYTLFPPALGFYVITSHAKWRSRQFGNCTRNKNPLRNLAHKIFCRSLHWCFEAFWLWEFTLEECCNAYYYINLTQLVLKIVMFSLNGDEWWSCKILKLMKASMISTKY